MNKQEKKITLATIKSFVRKNRDKLWISNGSHFDGMVDCVMPCSKTWRKAEQTDRFLDNNLAIAGAWFVLRGGDWYSADDSDGFVGYHISNCCGDFNLAVKVA